MAVPSEMQQCVSVNTTNTKHSSSLQYLKILQPVTILTVSDIIYVSCWWGALGSIALQINISTFSIQISCCKTTHPTSNMINSRTWNTLYKNVLVPIWDVRPALRKSRLSCPASQKVGLAPTRPAKLTKSAGRSGAKLTAECRFHWYPFPLCWLLMMS